MNYVVYVIKVGKLQVRFVASLYPKHLGKSLIYIHVLNEYNFKEPNLNQLCNVIVIFQT